jgi:hypothetical protein
VWFVWMLSRPHCCCMHVDCVLDGEPGMVCTVCNGRRRILTGAPLDYPAGKDGGTAAHSARGSGYGAGIQGGADRMQGTGGSGDPPGGHTQGVLCVWMYSGIGIGRNNPLVCGFGSFGSDHCSVCVNHNHDQCSGPLRHSPVQRTGRHPRGRRLAATQTHGMKSIHSIGRRGHFICSH